MFRRILASIVLAASACPADAADILNPDNGHYYRTVSPQSVPWELAKLLAFQQVREGQRGHLVTITSAAEQQFVMANFGMGGSLWTGGTQVLGTPDPASNWQWVTGEPFEYTNWYPSGEPNDAFTDEFVLEVFASSGYWNDTHLGGVQPYWPQIFQRRYVVEFTPNYEPTLTGADFLQWQRNLGRRGVLLGDFDGDRTVDADDLAVWQTYSGGGVQNGSTVPEPGTRGLLVVAAGVTATILKHRRI